METEALLNELDTRGNRLLKFLDICLTSPKTKAVHDLRVSIRRYLAATDALEQLIGKAVCSKKDRQSLKSLLDAYDQIRDMQVMIADLSSHPDVFLPESSFLAWLKNQVNGLAEPTFSLTEDKLTAIKGLHAKIMEKTRAGLKKLPPKTLDKLIDQIYKRADKLSVVVREEDPSTIHSLRIAFKRFRYSMEFFSASLEIPKDLFPRMRAYQTSLGKVQDASVLLGAMREFEEEDPSNQLSQTEQTFADARLTNSVQEFMVQLPQLKTFWRPNKNAQIPWRQVTSIDLNHFIEKLTTL